MSSREVLVHADAAALCAAAADRLIRSIVAAQAARGSAHVCLTGGRSGTGVLAAVKDAAVRDAVNWGRLDLWWSDERFLPAGDPERNDTGAYEALLDHVPLDRARVHPMPTPQGPDGDDVEAAAVRYAAELAGATGSDGGNGLPVFDVSLLGVGEDGHVASLFPGLPGRLEVARTVIAVHDSPKPPPVRVSLTMPALCTAREVWLVAAGEGKAEAMALALGGTAGEAQVPAGLVRGTERTVALLDAAAASRLPKA